MGATVRAEKAEASLTVSIHAPVWERRRIKTDTIRTKLFQSTLPCGSDPAKAASDPSLAVSIHAPVWERQITYFFRGVFTPFQSTLPCGSDFLFIFFLRLRGFNPRSRVGATFWQGWVRAGDGVSIHAPVWERQAMGKASSEFDMVSIHAPVWERLPIAPAVRLRPQFQSTLPCGSDGQAERVAARLRSFNPRSRVGATAWGPMR